MPDVIQEAIERMQRLASRSDVTDDDEDADGAAQDAKDYLNVLKDDKEDNKGIASSGNECTFFFFVRSLQLSAYTEVFQRQTTVNALSESRVCVRWVP